MGNLHVGSSQSTEVTPLVSLGEQDYFFDTILRNENGLRVDEFFLRMMKLKLGLSTYFSVQSVAYNMLLLAFLLRHKDFRSWAFFPVIMQCFIDICGPGVANVIYEWKLMAKYKAEVNKMAGSNVSATPYIRMEKFETFHRVNGLLGCVLLELRTFLNEYSTGFCLTATAFVRYMLVCQPSRKLTSNHHKVLAVSLVSVTLISLTLGLFEVRYNNFYSLDMDTGLVYRNFSSSILSAFQVAFSLDAVYLHSIDTDCESQ